MDDIYALKPDATKHYDSAHVGPIKNPHADLPPEPTQYQDSPSYVAEDDTEAALDKRGAFPQFEVALEGDRAVEILGGDVDEVRETIEAGDADDVLDVLRWCEHEKGEARVKVKEALDTRAAVLEQQQERDEETIAWDELSPDRPREA